MNQLHHLTSTHVLLTFGQLTVWCPKKKVDAFVAAVGRVPATRDEYDAFKFDVKAAYAGYFDTPFTPSDERHTVRFPEKPHVSSTEKHPGNGRLRFPGSRGFK